MQYKRFGSKVILRLDKGEEIIESVKKICETEQITLGTIMGIGATNQATIGLLDVSTKQYHSEELKGDHEIASLIGNITTMKDEVYLHIHATLGNKNHESFCGHLSAATVSVTFEGVIDIIQGTIKRVFDASLGINVLDL